MFDIINREISSRKFGIQRFASLFDIEEPSRSIEISICKGLVFVQLYGAYEYSITSSVQAALSSIRSKGLRVEHICRELLCLLLDPFWAGAAGAGRRKLWQKRIDVIEQMQPNMPLDNVSDTIFPNDGSQYRRSQIKTIWKVFGITDPIVPELRLLCRIDELVENRNAIAHGRITADNVGRLYTKKDIEDRIDDVFAISIHIVETIRSRYEP